MDSLGVNCMGLVCFLVSVPRLLLIPSVSLVVIKVMIGVNLVSYAASRRAGMEAREEADKINDFGRDPIGEGKEERVSQIFTLTIIVNIIFNIQILGVQPRFKNST